MAPDAVFVITVKLMRYSALTSAIEEIRTGLAAVGLFPYRAVHLFANKKQEFTVYARYAREGDVLDRDEKVEMDH